ncbi:Protein of unknown function [Gryllus bimaculatus]|nr:Protein of unknown function [Gryllus bimaculatus]
MRTADATQHRFEPGGSGDNTDAPHRRPRTARPQRRDYRGEGRRAPGAIVAPRDAEKRGGNRVLSARGAAEAKAGAGAEATSAGDRHGAAKRAHALVLPALLVVAGAALGRRRRGGGGGRGAAAAPPAAAAAFRRLLLPAGVVPPMRVRAPPDQRHVGTADEKFFPVSRNSDKVYENRCYRRTAYGVTGIAD